MTSSSGPQADRTGRSQVFTLRERAACLQLCVFHLFYEGDGPRHASCETVSPSNLGRPLEAVSGTPGRADSPEGHEQLRTSIVRPLATAVKLLLGLGLRRFRCLT